MVRGEKAEAGGGGGGGLMNVELQTGSGSARQAKKAASTIARRALTGIIIVI